MSVLNNDVYDLLEAPTGNDSFTFEPRYDRIENAESQLRQKPTQKVSNQYKVKAKIVQCVHLMFTTIRTRHLLYTFIIVFFIQAIRLTAVFNDVTKNVRYTYDAIERHMQSISELKNDFVTVDEANEWGERYLEAIGKKASGFREEEWMGKYNEALGKVVPTVNVEEDINAEAWSNTYSQSIKSHRRPRGWEYST